MDRYDRLYALYENFPTDTLRDRQNFIDLFPPVDSRVALEYWEDAYNELQAQKDEIRDAFVNKDGHERETTIDQEGLRRWLRLPLKQRVNKRLPHLISV
jgi:hypothetical protein